MDLFSIAGAMIRRWYLTIPLLLLVAFFAYRSYAAVEPLYMSTRSVVVLPSLPEEPEVGSPVDETEDPSEPDNPYSGQGGSRFAVAVLARNINSSAFEERLGLDESLEQEFEANSSSEQPMIHIEATAPSEEAVHDLLETVVAEASVVLDEFQAEAGAPEVTRYRIAPAVPAGPVEDVTPSRLRGAGAIAALGGGLTAVVVVGLDALLAARLRRRRAATEQGENDGAPDGGDHLRDDDAHEQTRTGRARTGARSGAPTAAPTAARTGARTNRAKTGARRRSRSGKAPTTPKD
ncbi:hypothetical protein [Georgenia sp. Z1491]|uniref:hypothetical protein n=1 Tax=Georgenia sp. Z1491 TaxID=3416707 RepID=UPI003CE9F2E9